MDFKVILTPQAQDDLREIVSFIARNNSSRARTFGNELNLSKFAFLPAFL